MIALLAGGLGLCVALTAFGRVPVAVVGIAAIAAGHGALLATALAWAMADDPRGSAVKASCAAPAVLVGLAALVATMHPAGALVYLAVPLWLWRLATRGRLVALGLGTPMPGVALALGTLTGTALAAHLLVTASMTLGYRPRVMDGAVLGAVAYDLGAQVLATECFFRGALFNRAQRRWSFGPATALSTGAGLVRYLIDPRLSGAVEIVVGMVFYVTLLSVANCWLFWRFGNLVPGVLGSLVFFAAYRTIIE